MEAFTRLFARLNIAMTLDVRHFLQQQSTARQNRLLFIKTTIAKKVSIQQMMVALKRKETVAKKERATRAGTYSTGMGFAAGGGSGFTEEELLELQPKPKKQKQAKPGTKKRNPDAVCKHCGQKGHSRRTHQACGKHVPKKTVVPTPTVEIDAAEAEALDCMPLDAEPPSDDELALFQDAGTWTSGDEEDNNIQDQRGLI